MRAMLLCVLCLAVASPAFAVKKPKNNDEAIDALSANIAAAWNKHDVQALAAYSAEDGDLINPVGREAKGRPAIEQLLKEEHSTTLKSSHYAATREWTRWVKPDVAVVDFTVELSGMTTPDGKEIPTLNHHLTTIIKKDKNQWWVVTARPYVFQQVPKVGDKAPASTEGNAAQTPPSTETN